MLLVQRSKVSRAKVGPSGQVLCLVPKETSAPWESTEYRRLEARSALRNIRALLLSPQFSNLNQWARQEQPPEEGEN